MSVKQLRQLLRTSGVKVQTRCHSKLVTLTNLFRDKIERGTGESAEIVQPAAAAKSSKRRKGSKIRERPHSQAIKRVKRFKSRPAPDWNNDRIPLTHWTDIKLWSTTEPGSVEGHYDFVVRADVLPNSLWKLRDRRGLKKRFTDEEQHMGGEFGSLTLVKDDRHTIRLQAFYNHFKDVLCGPSERSKYPEERMKDVMAKMLCFVIGRLRDLGALRGSDRFVMEAYGHMKDDKCRQMPLDAERLAAYYSRLLGVERVAIGGHAKNAGGIWLEAPVSVVESKCDIIAGLA